jgi:hypothetical protein
MHAGQLLALHAWLHANVIKMHRWSSDSQCVAGDEVRHACMQGSYLHEWLHENTSYMGGHSAAHSVCGRFGMQAGQLVLVVLPHVQTWQ